MNNRLKISDVINISNYNKNNVFNQRIKNYSAVCDLTKSKYISEVIDDSDRFILKFKNPIYAKYIYCRGFGEVDEIGNGSRLLKIKDEYIKKTSIKPIYGIYFKKYNTIDFENIHVIGNDNLDDYELYSHPNIQNRFCLGDLQRLVINREYGNYKGNDYVEYLINNIFLKPSFISPLYSELKIDGEEICICYNPSSKEKETIKKYFEKPDIIVF
jgi:hypothetical protein